MAVARYPAIGRANERHDAGQAREQGEGPRPPDLAREEDHGVGAAVENVVRGEDAHFMQQIFFGHGQALAHPGGLEGSEVEAARADASDAGQTPGPAGTEATV